MFNPFTDEEIQHVAELLEERVEEWSSSWPLKHRRTFEHHTPNKIPKLDKKVNLRERDVFLDFCGNRPESVILDLPRKNKRKRLPYAMYTISRHESQASYGTQKIRCNRLLVGGKGWDTADHVVLKKEFPNFELAKGELEDANAWDTLKENPGWRKLDDEYGAYKDKQRKQTRYELDILDDSEWDAVLIPTAAIHEWIPRSAFQWLSEQVGKEVSLDGFAEECLMFFPQEGAPHQLEVSKHKKRKERYNGKRVKFDACLAIYGSNGLDRDYPGEALFLDGKFVAGRIGAVQDATTPEEFKEGVKRYFTSLPVYELFEVYFCMRGLPESHREAIRGIL